MLVDAKKVIGLILLLELLCARVMAAGGVVGEAGSCMMEIGIYSAHFTIYQPEARGEDIFCEDLPEAANTLFVLDYLHGSLKDVPVDFRIIRDLDDLGIFARWEHVAAMTDLEQRTVFYQAASIRPENQLQAEHFFAEKGAYIGVVTAPHPTKDIVYRSVFPFRVGAVNWWLWIMPLLLLAALFLYYRKQTND